MVNTLITNYASTFAVVEYHVGASSGDQFTTPWGETRGSSFYNIWAAGIPWFAYDGLWDAWPINTYESKLLTRRAVATDIVLTMYGEQVSGQTYRVTVNARRETGGTGTKSMRIYTVEVLDAIWTVNGSTLPSYSRNVFRQAATTQDIALTPGQSAQVTREFTFAASPDWANQSKIKIIAWAQTPNSAYVAEVFQAQQMAWPFPAPRAGDIDADGDVDTTDLNLFVGVLLGTQTGAPYVQRSDLNGDGQRNGRDIQFFVNAFLAP